MLVAVCEFGCGDGIALGLEPAQGVFGDVAPADGLPLVAEVSHDGADEADSGGFVGEVVWPAFRAVGIVEPRARRRKGGHRARGGVRLGFGARSWI